MRPRLKNGLERPDLLNEPSAQAALVLLLGRLWCAERLQRNPGDLACELLMLRDLGLSDEELHGLVARGYIEHQAEPGFPAGARGPKRRKAGPRWSAASRFVLTDAGAALAYRLVAEKGMSPRPEVPRWEPATRELRYAGALVKRFRRAAPNQECILSTFQEMGWPKRIDDPISGEAGVDSEERLRQTVKDLNLGLRQRLLCFRVESDGRGVLWLAK